MISDQVAWPGLLRARCHCFCLWFTLHNASETEEDGGIASRGGLTIAIKKNVIFNTGNGFFLVVPVSVRNVARLCEPELGNQKQEVLTALDKVAPRLDGDRVGDVQYNTRIEYLN